MAACLAVVLLAGTMFSRLFGRMGSSKTTAAADQFQMFVAEAPDRENAAPESAAPALGEEKADRPDDDHAPADEPESANGAETGSCGSTSVTVTLGGSAHTIPGSDAVTLTAILENLDYTSDDICSCSTEFTVETEIGTEYEINLTEYFARCDAGQAALTQEQADTIREVIERLDE